ncbi:P-loop containing nucleoside triphosphate hydrolase protein [Sphaerulina musiva SO2202]|uniref:p-loop containing nucleoside triphosphate hydrolase protein n=1 Tax=Sphaerulina musiva (strain SO2202) TaxID=692275 RepID=N1QL22_SPHMS|nr:P-loop containing nucleoside triphosphate hydrolase protein [Sphaerulina musiva SO2202]EMF16323.1 P-loop containing nucleoside triphosphate hydrolase protein [Sphaerulina musiva SO2202]
MRNNVSSSSWLPLRAQQQVISDDKLLPSNMTAGGRTDSRPSGPRNPTSQRYFDHASADRVNTDVVIVESIRAEYPELHLTVVPKTSCDVLGFAAAGHAGVSPLGNIKDRLSWRIYVPPASRLNGKGYTGDQVKFGKYLVDWRNKEYIVYVAEGRDGGSAYPVVTNQYILSPSVEASNTLVLEAGSWGNTLHNEIWVFDGGYWQKSAELFNSVRKASWDDVILDEGMKNAIRNDVENFYDSRDTYEKLKVPWKRGIIYYGPPGNGKTISVKAIMNTLYSRDDAVPTLYVRTLSSFGGPEYSISEIFALARRTAPCLLVFEDLDSIVTDNVRSYFLNAIDGIQKNDGILMIGSTNHLDRLDPGIAKRPSRFDRKYLFPNPDEKERSQYMKYWQAKLADNKDVDFPDTLCPAVAKITKGFSFAYLQEAMVASLLALARDADGNSKVCLDCLEAHARPENGRICDRTSVRPFKGLYDYVWLIRRVEEDDPDLEKNKLWIEIRKQVRILREEMGDDDE